MTYADIIIQFHSPRRVQLDFFERLPHNIVGLSFALLGSFYCRGFIEIAFVIDIELAKGILKSEDLVLLELRVFPTYFQMFISQDAPGRSTRLKEITQSPTFAV